ncbi:androgen-binding protein homolog [Budorcas taxicolor]|uniref:androgen-binding protein homolog n=1 Tax=Budorcas taxicolor TaxID=37181 RepID=UPI002283AEDA|nr:androgen-binding protein homolog [Budorcas taxicolor]
MKGAPLVLALLVTRELTFETHEAKACPMFSAAFSSVALGSKTLLNSTLSLVDATDAENEAIGRIQDCFNEAGFDDKLLNIKSMISIILSEDCNNYVLSSVVDTVLGLILSVTSLAR